ncbi:MAG: hypothetical protein WBA97_38650 [Actinophytocola sp.]|uniref:hypothetical protein n=1 Tax=Actinophytocola sp. TaxID=1872138 RepID=UPI003C789BB1
MIDDSIAALRSLMVAASEKVRHPGLSLAFFVSSEYLDILDANDGGSFDGIPQAELEAARIRRGSVMLAADQVVDQCIVDLQLIQFGEDGLPDPDLAEDSFVYEEFPRRHRRAYNQWFFRKVLVTAVKVAYDLADPHGSEAACTAEEIIRHAIGRIATGLCELIELDEPDAHLEDALLEDLDFEDLFDDEMDGIEDDPARQVTWGIYVPGVADWFSPFNDDSVVHPYVETEPTTRPAVHNLFNRISDPNAHRAVFESPLLDSPTPLAGFDPASEAVALARQAAIADAVPDVWVADDTDPERSSTALLAAAKSAAGGSGWPTWEPYEGADFVRADPVVSFTPHRHFPVGDDQPWLWAAIGGGRLLAVPLTVVVAYQPDTDVQQRWNAPFGLSDE